MKAGTAPILATSAPTGIRKAMYTMGLGTGAWGSAPARFPSCVRSPHDHRGAGTLPVPLQVRRDDRLDRWAPALPLRRLRRENADAGLRLPAHGGLGSEERGLTTTRQACKRVIT